MKIFVDCLQGIGDQIYSRPFVKLLAADPSNEVYLNSVLPFLYSDIPGLKFIDPGVPKYRTQQKAYDPEMFTCFTDPPAEFDRTIKWGYARQELRKHNIVSHMEHAFGFAPHQKLDFTLPSWGDADRLVDHVLTHPLYARMPIAVIRPVTIRKEWLCSSRAPDPHYLGWAARVLRDAGYFIVSIADCAEGEEWIDGPLPYADLRLHAGELGIKGTLTLLKRASIVVGGSGFIIPAAVSAGTRLFIIFGGRGEYDNPHIVLDLRMDLKKIGWALPDKFCRCNKMEHACNKEITQLDDRFFSFMGRT